MKSNNRPLFAYFQNLVKIIKKIITKINKHSKKNKATFEKIQLTFIYFFAIVVLMYLTQSSIGYFPDILLKLVPFSGEILGLNILKFFSTPEKTFVLYLLITETIINRPIFRFSVLVKFNILYIFILEMLQNLFISSWDLLFSREIDLFSGRFIDKNNTIFFFCIFFFFFFLIYVYSYIMALQGRFPTLPGVLQRIVDSVLFWLQIKKADGSKEKK
jgi:hypothetical protein